MRLHPHPGPPNSAAPVRSTARKDVLTDVLDNVQMALKESEDLLSLAPVPGLAAAVVFLAAILERVKKMRSNAETAEAVMDEIRKLNDVIGNVVRQVLSRATCLQMKPEERPEMLKGFEDSNGWRGRVEQLRKELEELLVKAERCAQGPWYKRLSRSTRDEDTLKMIRTDLASTIQRFQLAGGLSIEALTEQNLAVGEATYEEVKRIAAAQEAEATKQEEERKKQQEARERSAIEAIPHADAAGYKSVSNVDKSYFLSGTRKVVFERLDEWVSSDKPVCFLIGAAGMGKSTIASEFCRRHEGELGASFFFRRLGGDPGVGSTVKFFPTIAYQLAHARPELRSHIVRAAQSDVHAAHSQMEFAVRALLHKPLQDAEAAGALSRMYIVVDALDECTESASEPGLVPECLRLLSSCALRHSSSIRLLITSRPDPDHVAKALRRDPSLKDSSVLLSLYDVEKREAVDRDITELIRTRLCDVEEGAQWYEREPSVVERLVWQSQGVFVFARTAVEFIVRAAGIAQMERRLKLLLTRGNTYGLGNLDVLYRTVLETAFPPADLDPETREQVRVILAWIALGRDADGIEPLVIEQLSGVPSVESIPILTKLRSVLTFDPGADDVAKREFRAMHITFPDFLVDRARCGDVYHVNPSDMHARLAVDCLRWRHHKGTEEINYANWYWHEHVYQASPTPELVGLLKAIFTSVSTDRPSLFFFSSTFTGSAAQGTALLRWVDTHVGRELAQVMGDQLRLSLPWYQFSYEAEITVHDPGFPGERPGALPEEEVEELRQQRLSQDEHFEECWRKNGIVTE
ncbi:hypothetical protein K466DRAFT_603345 [Polyporus arcularius HHB13444]|uniref:Nephrocystin 3-like N-terminal domain-containing protein n=1 Tax=Polyporus arcularius HHB13444 TaxID=1314778 RepID=A0A5C3P2K6_9APHY|nr:hypothetical protein K466DRAFT_603345 [Polyporus arcularius HHB13444]